MRRFLGVKFFQKAKGFVDLCFYSHNKDSEQEVARCFPAPKWVFSLSDAVQRQG